MIPGDQITKLGTDEHLVKRCTQCGGEVWLLVQNGRLAHAVSATCRCLMAHVIFEVSEPP